MNQVFIFIYSKNGKIKALGVKDAKIKHDELIKNGFKHTQTIDGCAWIEYLCNSCDNIKSEIKSFF